jgi:AraC-like DNA-binding protein
MRQATSLQPRWKRLPRRRREIAALAEQRRAWLATLAPDPQFHQLFDYLPGVSFFAKDRAGRTMFASRGILERYRMRDVTEMLGLTDFDINPGSMAEVYARDDDRLLSGAAKRIERLELWFDRQGMPDWYVVTKLPVLDRGGRPAGVMGVLRPAEENEMQLPVYQTVAQAVKTMRLHFARPILIAQVARQSGQSLRQLQRRFQEAIGVTPQEFLLRTRVLAAVRLLEETGHTTKEIAARCGFADASSFTQHFKKRVGISPAAYRRRLAPSRPSTRRPD